MSKAQEIYIANPFVVQIHLNKRCSLACSYCYLRNVKGGYINTEYVKKFLTKLGLFAQKHNFKIHINLTGGDLFFHPKIEQICQDIYQNASIKSISLLVNTLWYKKAYKIVLMLKNKLDAIQVNIDLISSRIDDIKFLKKNNIKTIVKIMLAKNNDIERQIKIAKGLQKVNPEIVVSVDRFCPQSASDYGYMLNCQELIKKIEMLKRDFSLFITDDPLVESIINKTSDIINDDQNIMRGCIIPNGGLAIFPDGKIKLCARIPQFETGFNIKNFDLIKYIQTFDYISNTINKKCAGCNLVQLCDGGCVATSYSLNNNFSRDAQCVKNAV